MKRFWDDAAVAELPDGFGVALDGRPLRLPGGGGLRLPRRSLAEAVAEEWRRAGGTRGGEASLEELPLTRLIGTAQDRIAPDPAPSVEAIAAYGATDLLCYRATERALAEKQARDWQPLLDWAALELDALLRVTTGLMPVDQDPASLAALRRAVVAHTPLELAALGVAVPALGSLVLGLALSRGRLDAAEAHRLATLDEAHQEAFWGVDAEAAARRVRAAADVALADRLLHLARAA
ncbi:chaperone, ATP12 [Roseomonas sp. OT10]|uniref:ATP12 family chaperone protein n=1 Tax=Roseomonas cutis TaxID=2897332 RepID=UPI001E4248A7|nr:ATP12 family protein [Roseomonas sp. OT10]UFN51146.1 chaperone, ATP12 [Roseomonas sp. OT10]